MKTTSNKIGKMKKEKKSPTKVFLDLKVPVFYNKKNGQISISLPKKKIKKIIGEDKDMPKQIPIRLFNWFKGGKN